MSRVLQIAINTGIGFVAATAVLIFTVLFSTVLEFLRDGILLNGRLQTSDGIGFIVMVLVLLVLCYVFGRIVRRIVGKEFKHAY